MDVEAPGVGAMCGACPEGYIEVQEKCIGTRGSDSVHDDIIYYLPLMCISKSILIRKVSLSYVTVDRDVHAIHGAACLKICLQSSAGTK